MAHLMIVRFSPFKKLIVHQMASVDCRKIQVSMTMNAAAAAVAATVYSNKRPRDTLLWLCTVNKVCAFCFSSISLVASYRLDKQMMMLPCYKFNLFRLKAYFMDSFSPLNSCKHTYVEQCAVCTLARTLTAKSFRRLTINKSVQ